MNNFLDLTAGSTHATNVAVKLYMPVDEAARALAYFDRLQALEAKQPDSAHARQCRSNNLEALVLLALDNDTLRRAVMQANKAFRITLVIDHLNYYKEDHGTVKKRYDIEKAPCRKTIKAILIKHGYYF
ncbi:hypothetical protein [Pseudomonas sp. FW300-N2A2]|uniref:hypothetical protein n=1 Tax=Pseudomonas sp. FW300-N2A2 TaxID=2751316 RepID=UPI001A91CD43|nr:hypothetical protein [Pseudomonas sp. FW300-N2A2]